VFALGVLSDEASPLAAEAGPPRKVWLADSFAGLPYASTPQDGDFWHNSVELRVSEEHVRETLRGYGFDPDEQIGNTIGNIGDFGSTKRRSTPISFIPGYFNESFAQLSATEQAEPIAVLRVDADMYESTWDVLFSTYGRVSAGGFVIIDDWGVREARLAVNDFFAAHGQPMPPMVCAGCAAGGGACSNAAYWRKGAGDMLQAPDMRIYGAWCATRRHVSGERVDIGMMAPSGEKFTRPFVLEPGQGLLAAGARFCGEHAPPIGLPVEVCMEDIGKFLETHFNSPIAAALSTKHWYE
jgi:hypothetical protein